MKPPTHKDDKSNPRRRQQKKHAEQKSSSRSNLKSPKSVRCRSKFSRAELKEKADRIRNSPYIPDIIKNNRPDSCVLVWAIVDELVVARASDRLQLTMVELGNRAGVSLRATQTAARSLEKTGAFEIDPVKLSGHLAWRNDSRGNFITLLVKGRRPEKPSSASLKPSSAPFFSRKEKEFLVVENGNNNSEPTFNEKNRKKGFGLSPELEFELDTFPQSTRFGKIREKLFALLNLSNMPGLRNQQIKKIAYDIAATARNKTEADTLNRLLSEGIRMDKEDMMKGEIPRALMGLFSVAAKLKTATGGIRCPAAYLIGYLKKPRAQQRGYQSLAALVKIMPSAPVVDRKIQRAIEPATMHDGVFVRAQQLFKQIEPWRPMPESKKELVGRFNPLLGEVMGDCHPMAKKDLTDRHGQWAIPIVLSVRLSNLLRKKDGCAPIRSELAYVKALSKKDSLDNPLPYVDAILAKAGVDLVVTGIVAREIEELPGSERGRRVRAPEQNFHARKFPLSAVGDIFGDISEAAANHAPLDVAEMKKFSAKIKPAVRDVKETG